MQKEAYRLRTPCITLRDATEWVETVEDDWNTLVGTDKNKIIEAVKKPYPESPQRNVYGNGGASVKIRDILKKP